MALLLLVVSISLFVVQPRCMINALVVDEDAEGRLLAASELYLC